MSSDPDHPNNAAQLTAALNAVSLVWRLLQVLAFVAGLPIGVFLFFRLHHILNVYTGSWLLLYETALLLSGLGIAGLFPGPPHVVTFMMAVLGMAVGSGIGESIVLSGGRVANTLGPLPVVAWFLQALGPLLWGWPIFWLVRGVRVPRLVFVGLLMGGVALGDALPRIEEARFRHLVAQMPSIVRGIYEAEIAYSRSRVDDTFICNGHQHDGFQWSSSNRWDSLNKTWVSDGSFRAGFGDYRIVLACSADGSGFQITAGSCGPINCGPTFTMNETGRLVVTEGRRN